MPAVAVSLLLVVSCSIFWPTLLSHYALTSSSRKDVIRKFWFEEAESLKPGQLVFFKFFFFNCFVFCFCCCVCVCLLFYCKTSPKSCKILCVILYSRRILIDFKLRYATTTFRSVWPFLYIRSNKNKPRLAGWYCLKLYLNKNLKQERLLAF